MSQVETACRLVAEIAGLDLRPYKEAVVQRRLQSRAKDRGLASVRQYLEWLEAGGREQAGEARKLFSSASVRVSWFFRDEAVFGHLEENVFPAVAAGRGAGEPVRVWSAACAFGQEAYSLAIGLLRFLRQHGLHREVRVLGTDLDAAAVETARAGNYPARSMKAVPPEVLKEHFEPLPGGLLSVAKDVRRAARFEVQDLLRFELHPADLDLVCCRNLLIYLRREVQEELILALARALRPGGFLVLGQGETILGRPWRAFEHVSPGHKVYRKPL